MPTDLELRAAHKAKLDLIYGAMRMLSANRRELTAALGLHKDALLNAEESFFDPLDSDIKRHLTAIVAGRYSPELPRFTQEIDQDRFSESSKFVTTALENLGMTRRQLARFIDCNTYHITAIQKMTYTLTAEWREKIQELLDSPPSPDDELWGPRHLKEQAKSEREST